MFDLIVTGGGAAGLVCAVTAAERGLDTLVLERLDRVGRKLLATGNGRCNLMNTGAPVYPEGGAFAEAVLSRYGADVQKAFWERHGLRLRQEEGGRVYPVSGHASSVLDTLRFAAERAGVKIVTGTQVTAVSGAKGNFTVKTDQGVFRAANVAVTGGGCAQPKLGSDGSSAGILTTLGHRAVPFIPALCAVRTDPRPIAGLSGIRVRAALSVWKDESCLHREAGEVLFTDDGVSGVCTMNCSLWAEPGTALSLDFLGGIGFVSAGDALNELRRRRESWPVDPAEHLLAGLFVPRLGNAAARCAGVRFKDRVLADLKDDELRRITDAIGNFRLETRSLRGFDQAQAARGGILAVQFDPETLESKLVPGLYAGGEVLNVTGICGGFNLMFAFGCGLAAGSNAEVCT